jgi:diguanylate cyclase (GGDEF)-like protein
VTVTADSLPHEDGPDERDAAAEKRDRGAERRDALAYLQDASIDPSTSIDLVLQRAARERVRAAADRARASEDRARASIDRRDAARDRSEALALRAEAAHNLKLAATDGLTGTWTRKFGLEAAAREVERAHRTGQGAVLAFVDVDGLKRVNDLQGHARGDALLAAVGETLRAGLRPYDVVVRYGGDEFLALMADTSLDAARSRFGQIAVTLAAGGTARSFSVGIAEACAGETLELLIERADADLFVRRRARRANA